MKAIKEQLKKGRVNQINIYFSKSIDEAKDLVKAAGEAILTIVRRDESTKHNQLIKCSVVQVLGRQTTKRMNFGGDSEI
jgi:hypothetical protein